MKSLARLTVRFVAKYKLIRAGNVLVTPTSQVEYRKVLFKYGGCTLKIGDNSLIDSNLVFEKEKALISIGNNTFVSGAVLSCASNIRIGSNVQIAWGVIIFDHNSHSMDYMERRNDLPKTLCGAAKTWRDVLISSVNIEDDVWIGANSIILKGVSIGKGAIIGAGSVVTKDIPPMVVVAGNPARIVKRLDDDSTNNTQR